MVFQYVEGRQLYFTFYSQMIIFYFSGQIEVKLHRYIVLLISMGRHQDRKLTFEV